MKNQKEKIKKLQRVVWAHYKKNGRRLQWRDTIDPYWIVVSEIMLQQTQVPRVIEKFPEFIKAFPTFRELATASDTAVLRHWQGLGYNRRGLYIKRIAEIVTKNHGGQLPQDRATLERFPGIGPNTAGSILAFAFNLPEIFIETNVRTVFLHHLFPKKIGVTDKELLPLIEEALPKKRARQWYWALMDYGTFLKKQFKNPSRASAHHTKQSKFEGSHRQVRGATLKTVLAGKNHTAESLSELLPFELRKIQQALDELFSEGFIKFTHGRYHN